MQLSALSSFFYVHGFQLRWPGKCHRARCVLKHWWVLLISKEVDENASCQNIRARGMGGMQDITMMCLMVIPSLKLSFGGDRSYGAMS